ncbi:MAG: N-acetyltransferase [Hyphomicrobium sp.]|nr:MAG: N-acetyltransferase [Hyphomicrobium sp.]
MVLNYWLELIRLGKPFRVLRRTPRQRLWTWLPNLLETLVTKFDERIFIHQSSYVDPGAKLGVHTSIWHFVHVEGGAIVGENCNIGQNCYIGNNAVVGNACRLGNSVAIFSHVELGDFVFCAPYMVFTHIDFPRAAVSRREVFVKTLVGTGSTLGANCTVVPGIEIGTGTFVAAGATLTGSTADWSLMIGTPARHVGWVSAYGERIALPLTGQGSWTCPHTGDTYVLEDKSLRRIAGPDDLLSYKPGAKLERRVAV